MKLFKYLSIHASILLFGLTALQAIQTKSKILSSYNQFIDGEFENVFVSNLGRLGKAAQLEKLADIDGAEAIWDSVRGKDGTIYIATGSDSAIYRLKKGGEIEVYFEPGEILTHAVAIGPDGALYVGTSPNGVIYRIEEGERPEIYYDPDELYIWDLKFDKEGGLFIATGSEARVYRLPPDAKPDAKAELWLESEREHINTLALDDTGAVLAGTTTGAYLYRVAKPEEGELLTSGNGNEITAIHPKGEYIFSPTLASFGKLLA